MRVWMWVAVTGCATAGQAKVDDFEVDPGVPVGAYRWHDATGQQVTEGAEPLVWVDGLLWRVDPETGGLGGVRLYGEQIYRVSEAGPYEVDSYGLFFSVRCDEGPAYVKAPPPRLVVDGYLWGEEGVLYTRPEDVMAVLDADGSAVRAGGASCGEATIPLTPLVRLDELTTIGIPPSSGWVPPLRLEPIE